MELVIVTLAVLVAAAEITAIVRVAEKETSLKNFQLLSVSLFPLIHITIEKRRCKKAHCFTEDNVSVNISAINDAVIKGDSKFKFTDCYNMAINGRISDDYIITNKESAYLLDTIYVCYDELFVMLNDSLSKRDYLLLSCFI